MPIVDYYISLNSPWTFLGSGRFIASANRHGAEVHVKPARFADVFAQTGGLPLAQRSPARRAYRMMELKRWREHLAIPIVLEPAHFPSDEAPATRLVIAAGLQGLDALRLSSEIGRQLWVEDRSIADPAVLDEAMRRVGIDPVALRSAAPPDAELDAQWQRNTEEAVARGVFGAPSYVLQSGEIFWGQDRVDFLERALAQNH